MKRAQTTTIENVTTPGHTRQVDAEKYQAMKAAMLRVVPKAPPGLTAQEMREKLLPLLPEHLWPGGEKVGWWQKGVQLDLEAKGHLRRDENARPLRWYRTA